MAGIRAAPYTRGRPGQALLFNSLGFFVFLGVVLALTLPAPRRLQNPLLLVASYVFYAAWDWRFLGLIAFSTALDYTCALAIDRATAEQVRRRWLTVSVVANLGVLAFFKYSNFILESLRAVGVPLRGVALDVVLPVGISFYTFQTMSYTIDVYRRRIPATRDLGTLALYVAYFPQLVAGPIERAAHLLPLLAGARQVTRAKVESGAWLVLLGLFKKVVVADNMARIVDPVFGGAGPDPGAATLLAIYAFALQIYADFSGYTDIARGVSRILGVELIVNFRRPYFATNPREFWQRWHISLSEWLRDYLYIPLGGNRGGTWRNYRNLLLTMLLGGLWHGASWMFVIWGAIHGGVLVIHRAWSSWRGERPAGLLARAAAGVLFFHAVCFAWIFFRAESMAAVGDVFRGLGGGMAPGGGDLRALAFMAVCAGPLLLLDVWEEVAERRGTASDAWPRVFAAPPAIRGLIYALLVAAIAVVGAPAGAEFIYFQF